MYVATDTAVNQNGLSLPKQLTFSFSETTIYPLIRMATKFGRNIAFSLNPFHC